MPTISVSKAEGLDASVTGAPDYSHEDEIIEKLIIEQHLHEDGTVDGTSTTVVHVLTEAGVRAEEVFRLPYAEGEADIKIVSLKVRKPDGQVIETSPDDAQDTAAPVTEAAPMYSDVRVKNLPVKGLSAGDTLEVQVAVHQKRPLAPGQYWSEWSVPDKVVIKDYELTMHVPANKYFLAVSHTVQPEITTSGGDKVYHWHTAQLKPTPDPAEKKDETAKDKKDKATDKKDKEDADIEVTTFKSWDEVGAWFAGLQQDRITPTAEVKAKADELVKGKTTDEERVRALYSYVSTQFRYIGVELGVGKYQAHSAATVMDNRFGDCKDKHTLLTALLAAEGYKAEAALIKPEHKLERIYPAPSQFDHVITAVDIQGKRLWMDSTAETAPFQLLMPGLRDEDALLIAPDGKSELVKTPPGTPFPLHSEWNAAGALSKDGTYLGHVDYTVRDDLEVVFRMVFRQVPRTQWDQLISNVLSSWGLSGKVTNVDISDAGDLSRPFVIHFDYTEKESDWNTLQFAPVVPHWTFLPNTESARPDEPFRIDGEGEHTYISSLSLPAGYGASPASASRYNSSFVDYSRVSTFKKDVLDTTVKINVRPEKTAVARWDDYLHWERQVESDQGTEIAILRPGEKPATEYASDPEAARLVQEAYASLQKSDLPTAQQDLDEAKALNPQQEGLHAVMATYDSMNGHYDEAVAEYRQELQLYPRHSRNVGQFAQFLVARKQPDAAMKLLRAGLEASPSDPQLLAMLGSLLVDNDRSAEAITLLQQPARADDATVPLKLLLARAYSLSGRTAEATPLLAATMKNSEDQGELNDAAYFASLANVLLPEAEAASAKSLDKLATAEEKVTLSNVGQQDLLRVSQTANGWDTYGWILFQQGKTKQAETYVRAAWVLRQAAEVGEHLGEILQKEGRKDEAVHTLRLALAAGRNNLSEEVRKKAEAHLHQLGADVSPALSAKAGTPAEHPEQAAGGEAGDLRVELSRMRTIHVPSHVKEFGSAEFFVLMTADGNEDVQFISGKDEMRDTVAGLKSADFRQPFPPGSKARLVRRGVVTCSAGQPECTVVLTPVDLARAQ